MFLKVKDIHLTAEPFSLENGLLTPTLKLKRVVSHKKYAQVFKDMYAKINLEQPASTLSASL